MKKVLNENEVYTTNTDTHDLVEENQLDNLKKNSFYRNLMLFD
ncbi:hypothetical protein [Peptostreptococcus faecalis]|nr:hypothetical protein [Peptostreptococcus faecalis]